MGTGSTAIVGEALRDVRQRGEAGHVEVEERRHVFGGEPKGVAAGRVPGEDDGAAARHAGELGKPRRAIHPVMHREDRERGVDRGIRERQVLGDRLHDRGCSRGRWRIISLDGSTAVTKRSAGS